MSRHEREIFIRISVARISAESSLWSSMFGAMQFLRGDQRNKVDQLAEIMFPWDGKLKSGPSKLCCWSSYSNRVSRNLEKKRRRSNSIANIARAIFPYDRLSWLFRSVESLFDLRATAESTRKMDDQLLFVDRTFGTIWQTYFYGNEFVSSIDVLSAGIQISKTPINLQYFSTLNACLTNRSWQWEKLRGKGASI